MRQQVKRTNVQWEKYTKLNSRISEFFIMLLFDVAKMSEGSLD